jgi:3-phosphoshikimate 1-carboxyvinyltransferase
MTVYSIAKTGSRKIEGRIALAGSKSISNRVLIIRALCGTAFPIDRLANARDTELLDQLLRSDAPVRDAGAAGTTFRFLTAYLSAQPGEQLLTGTERMKQRPIGPLVDALRQLGARIHYVEREGYPPLRIGPSDAFGLVNELSISADTSSQYVTALLLLAPTLPSGLRLHLEGRIVSRPYIAMTLNLMQYFGVTARWENNHIEIAPQNYQPRPFTVEADWSAASYYYSLAALSDSADLQLDGLFADSVQGDAVIVAMYRSLGVESTFNDTGVRLQKKADAVPPGLFEWDFLECPDVAQTLAVTCAGLGVQGLFTGLETLRIKETDRIAALQTELRKTGVSLAALPARFSKKSDKAYFIQQGKATWEEAPEFATYEDHRMAMAFAPFALLGPVRVAEPEVVAKSYPLFWQDLATLGFAID